MRAAQKAAVAEKETISLTPEEIIKAEMVFEKCDTCGNRAYVKTRVLAGVLTWCGHHFARVEKTGKAGVVVADTRETLSIRETKAHS